MFLSPHNLVPKTAQTISHCFGSVFTMKILTSLLYFWFRYHFAFYCPQSGPTIFLIQSNFYFQFLIDIDNTNITSKALVGNFGSH